MSATPCYERLYSKLKALSENVRSIFDLVKGKPVAHYDLGPVDPILLSSEFSRYLRKIGDTHYYPVCFVTLDFTEVFTEAPFITMLLVVSGNAYTKTHIHSSNFYYDGMELQDTHSFDNSCSMSWFYHRPTSSKYMDYYKSCFLKYTVEACSLLCTGRGGGYAFQYDSKDHNLSVQRFLFMCTGRRQSLETDRGEFLEFPIVSLMNPTNFIRFQKTRKSTSSPVTSEIMRHLEGSAQIRRPEEFDSEPMADFVDLDMCAICSRRSAKTTIIQCEHVCMCVTCSRDESVTTCPLCGKKIQSVIRIYNNSKL